MRNHLFLAALLTAAIGCPNEKAGSAETPSNLKQPASQPASGPSTPPPPAAASAAGDAGAGKRLYLTACANCHGPDGTGSMMRQALPKIGDLTSPEMHARMSDKDITTLIQTGRDKMPAFGTMFKDDQLNAIVAYVRTLKRQQ